MKIILTYNRRRRVRYFRWSVSNWGYSMNFEKMVNSLNKDIKAYRPSWGEGELLWKKSGVLVHNTPYWGGEVINQYLGGYAYICEKEDIEAKDWILVKEE